jgi:clan AA aspartic protease
MITGTVNVHREAILRLAVFDASSNPFPSDAVVDTGFDGWISLPPTLVATLGLRWKRFGRALLADGSESLFDVYEAKVLWDGHARLVPVYEMDADPLVGMSLMYGYELTLPILDGATFTLQRITNP